MSTALIVLIETSNDTIVVSTKTTDFVGQLLGDIQTKSPESLGKVDLGKITLHSIDGLQFGPTITIAEVLSKISITEPLIVRVTPGAAGPAAPPGLQQQEQVEQQPVRKLYDPLRTGEGIQCAFPSRRVDTIGEFWEALFPSDGKKRIGLLFMRAPPCSGKTAFAQLLCDRAAQTEDIHIAYISLAISEENECVSSVFKRVVGLELKHFILMNGRKLLIMDEAQLSYGDDDFWSSVVKPLMSGAAAGLSIVMLSAYGSFNPYQAVGSRLTTPILIDDSYVYGLSSSPGLRLSVREIREILEVADKRMVSLCEEILKLSEGHPGMTHKIVSHLCEGLKNVPGEVCPNLIEDQLRSQSMIQTLSSLRGVPTRERFYGITKSAMFDSNTKDRMYRTLERVAYGEVLPFRKEYSPGTKNANVTLILHGFLIEQGDGLLEFPSNLHATCWLESTRKEPIEHIVDQNNFFTRFIEESVRRMSATGLQAIRKQNVNKVREQQFQMQLYGAMTRILPRDVCVIPERATGCGWVDLYVDAFNGWYFELLVDGDRTSEHLKRFQPGGRYRRSPRGKSASLNAGRNVTPKTANFILIDFRESISPRQEQDSFVYIRFNQDYTTAYLSGSITAELKLIG